MTDDKELREALVGIICTLWGKNPSELLSSQRLPINQCTDKLIELITAKKAQWQLEARLDENESILSVAEHEIELGEKCYNHEKHTPACYACRKRKMYVKYSKDWQRVTKERVAQLTKEAHDSTG